MKGQKKRNSATLGYTLALIAGLCVLLGMKMCTESRQYKRCSGIVWTTQYNITYDSDRVFDDSIQSVFAAVDNSLSMYNKSSVISRINRGEDLSVDTMLTHIYEASVKVHQETEGAFDPTVSPLMRVWGFVEKGGDAPSAVQIDSIMQFVGLEHTSMSGGKIVKTDSRTAFDFSAIAKGYACDEVGRMLERNGVKNYLVEIGGEITLKGKNPSGTEWLVSVDRPIESNTSVVHDNMLVVGMNDGAIATSGNYRNYKDIDGKKVVHTMNPKTGYPEETNLLSVTIVADNCMLADAYATACMVMGAERSKSFLESHSNIGGFIVYTEEDDSMVTWSNDRFNGLVR